MATAEQKRIYNRTLNEIAKRFDNLQEENLRQMIKLLSDYRKAIGGEIAVTDFDQFRIDTLLETTGNLTSQLEARLVNISTDSINGAIAHGANSFVEPLVSIGIQDLLIAPSPAQLNVLVDFSADLISGMTNKALAEINTQIRIAALGQRSAFDTMREITRILGVRTTRGGGIEVAGGVGYNAERILRTEMGRAYNLSHHSQLQATAERVPDVQKRWIAAGDNRTRRSHLQIHMETFNEPIPANEPFSVGGSQLMYPGDPSGAAKETINCLLPGNSVIAPGKIAMTRAHYEGMAIELTIRGGKKITITPNHPILTDRGFIAARFLKEGDDVISSGMGQEIADAIYPYEYHMPSPIEDIWNSMNLSALKSSELSLSSMPRYFYGDGEFIEGNIDIVSTDGLLRSDVYNTPFGKHINKESFGGRLVLEGSFTGDRSRQQLFGTPSFTPNGIVGIASKGEPFFGSHRLHSNGIGFTRSPGSNTSRQQPTSEGWPRYTDLASQFILRFSSKIAIEPIIKIRNFHFSGHVYDLQTLPQLYISNTFIVHNCRCREVVVYPDVGVIDSPRDEQVAAQLEIQERERAISFEERRDRARIIPRGAAEEIFERDEARWRLSLTEDESDAIFIYTGSSYRRINGELRDGTCCSEKWMERTKDRIDSGLSKNSLKEDTVLYRGMDFQELKDKISSGIMGINDLIEDDAFVSTTTDSSMVSKFGGDSSIRMEILAPAGTRGGYVSPFSKFPEEQEFLLARGTKFRILEIEERETGATTIRVIIEQ